MSDCLYVGTRKGLFVFEPNDEGLWQIAKTAFLSVPVVMLLPDSRDNSLYVGLDHGHFGVKMHRSVDRGDNWEECSVPEYPPRPDDCEDMDPIRQVPLEWKLKLIWSLEAGGNDQPNLLWCGTIPGGLFKSEDRGDSWQLVESLWNHEKRKMWFGGGADLPGIHSICVDPRDSKQVRIGVSCGGVWYSGDGGASWENRSQGMWAAYMPPEQKDDPNIQDPHRVVQCPTQPEKLWAQHHNGVFRSTDEGNSWQEVTIEPSSFGFAVAVHPQDGDTAWFVPAVKDEERIPVDGKVVVTRTRDGGKSCEVLREGLPQQHAYDLTYRHALDIDDSGNCLAFGSTTGNLWYTDNQGDSWQTLSTHLPPVYCVRFDK